MRCSLTGFFCKFGYERRGDGCFLKAQICEGTDILNYDKTKCVPQPDFLIPAPLLIIGSIATFFIVRDKRANPDTSRFFANMIAMASILETVGLLCLCGLTGEYGITPSFYLSLLGVCFLYGMNLFFQLIYQKSMKEDSQQPTLKAVVALLKLGDWDPDVFYKFRDVVLNQVS